MVKKELTKSEISAIDALSRRNILVTETHYDSGIYGVNWPGKGTKSVGETLAFIKELRKAITLANRINKRKQK